MKTAAEKALAKTSKWTKKAAATDVDHIRAFLEGACVALLLCVLKKLRKQYDIFICVMNKIS